MFIENIQYSTNMLSVINDLRRVLFSLYNNASYIMDFQEALNGNMNCKEIEYSHNDFAFTVKVNRGLDMHCPDTYYGIICNVFRDFISAHEHEVLRQLKCMYTDAYKILLSIYENHHIMANLCHITCFNDDIIYIKL